MERYSASYTTSPTRTLAGGSITNQFRDDYTFTERGALASSRVKASNQRQGDRRFHVALNGLAKNHADRVTFENLEGELPRTTLTTKSSMASQRSKFGAADTIGRTLFVRLGSHWEKLITTNKIC